MILAIDPSMTCTGYALLIDGGDDGRIVEAGTISPPAGLKFTLLGRLKYLVGEVQQLVNEHVPSVYVVEAPQTRTIGKGRTRSPATLPAYGCAVGAMLVGVQLPGPCVTVAPSATEWTAGLPATRDDPDKTQRVFLVEHLYGYKRGALGAKSVAGNVADAILLARWALLTGRHYEPTAEAAR